VSFISRYWQPFYWASFLDYTPRMLRLLLIASLLAVLCGLPRCSIVVLAGDISPIDVISHIPVLCEESSVPYVFVSSKSELGAAAATKRPTSVVLVHTAGKGAKPAAFADMDKATEVVEEIKELPKDA